ncbi:hypothetical protein CEUSTIGMA_g8399.t1, partial [Chlamydomonas eustigma]
STEEHDKTKFTLACQSHDLCSVGKVKYFLGDIYDSSALREALEARSFNKEIILIANSLHKLGGLLQVVSNLEYLGYSHILLLSYNREECEGLVKLLPQLGCVWTSFSFDPDSGMHERFVLWFLRYRTMVRALRLGYNVFLMDNDVVFFEDPYTYFKRPPFSSFTVINQQEWPNSHTANGGFIYVQNAQANGPTVWLFMEVTDRVLRYADKDWAWIRSLGLRRQCMHMDQDMLKEVLGSVAAGRPIWRSALSVCQPGGPNSNKTLFNIHKNVQAAINWDSHAKVVIDVMINLDSHAKVVIDVMINWDSHAKDSSHQTPPHLLHLVHDDTYKLLYLNMTLPNNHGVWPEELGGRIYPPERSSLSKLFQEQLMADCPQCPIMPDHEKGEDAAAAAAIPSEAYLFAPPWLVTSWWYRGRLGLWDPRMPSHISYNHHHHLAESSHHGISGSSAGLPSGTTDGAQTFMQGVMSDDQASSNLRPYQTAIGHVHWVQSACDFHANSMKAIPLMAARHYNWTAAHAATGEHVYFCTQNSYGHPLKPDLPLPKLLALSPQLQASLKDVYPLNLTNGYETMRVNGLQAFQHRLMTLARLAILSDRVPVWPSVDCSAPFIFGEPQSTLRAPLDDVPWGWLPHWDSKRGLIQCFRMMLMEPGCLFEGRGMTEWELEHLMQRMRELSSHNLNSMTRSGGGGESGNEVDPALQSDASQHTQHNWGDLVEGVNTILLEPIIAEEKANLAQRISSTVNASSVTESEVAKQLLDQVGESVIAAMAKLQAEPVLYLLDLPLDVTMPSSRHKQIFDYKSLMIGCHGLHCQKCYQTPGECLPF